ncbi:glycine betaine transporter BetP [uncultured Corynebacterium sp.]|uniref:glycine betaine transporter BetP n=1 Tax=uncultured Corynebacterium sp. TaxID=159447 RepID=UPI0025F30CA0|nr:glycine betaine transporter BetP [uncultured Corynebacterium sp.]
MTTPDPNLDKPLVGDEIEQLTATEELAGLLKTPGDIGGQVADSEPEIVLQGESTDAKLQWAVILPALAVVLGAVVWGIGFPDSFSDFAGSALSFVVSNLGWAFILFGTVFVFFAIAIAASKFGQIKLGHIDEAPEFRTISWISMMFAAGMGIGLMFYGTSEPLTFYRTGVPGHQPNEVGTAMSSTLFHWTLHPWAIYAIVGLAIAYSTFRVGRKQLLSSAFVPLIGQKGADGWLGKLVDILAIIATVFGTACSLGLGALQIGAGLSAANIIDNPGQWTIVGIVSILTLAFILSAISGVGKGIQYLSNFNMVLAALLAVFVFVIGPTVSVLNLIPGSIGNYFSSFFEMAGRTAMSADGTAGEWLGGWTIFYWAWWISWSPFVGMFLARISRGRSIREFILGVMLVPAGVSTIWFSIFGGTAIVLEQNGESIWGTGSAEEQLFSLLQSLPGGGIMAIVAMILLSSFFITSADSASTVMGSMSQNGQLDANKWVSAAWGLATAAIGLTLLVSGGDSALNNLQNVTIVAATPFLFVIIGLMFAILKDLRNDVIYLEYREQQKFSARLARERRVHAEHQRRIELSRRKRERQANRTTKRR